MWRGAVFSVSLEQIGREEMSSPLSAFNFAVGFQLRSKVKSMKIRNKTESKASRGPMISTQISLISCQRQKVISPSLVVWTHCFRCLYAACSFSRSSCFSFIFFSQSTCIGYSGRIFTVSTCIAERMMCTLVKYVFAYLRRMCLQMDSLM